MTDLDTMFPQPNVDALSILLGHDAEEAAAWWLGADLAGIQPGTVQSLLLGRRSATGVVTVDDLVETGIAAVSAFLVPVASSLAEIDALHDTLGAWLAPMLDDRIRTGVLSRAEAALELLDDPLGDGDESHACVAAVQATAFDVSLANALCSVNVVRGHDGHHRVAIVACMRDDEDACFQIGELPFPSDDGDGPSDRSYSPIAPVPLLA